MSSNACSWRHSLWKPLEVGTAEAEPPCDILDDGVLDPMRNQISKHRGAHLLKVNLLQAHSENSESLGCACDP